MRITIDIDGRVTEPVSGATPTVATPVTETADGGAAPAVSPSGATANTSAEARADPRRGCSRRWVKQPRLKALLQRREPTRRMPVQDRPNPDQQK